ncbi:MAG: PEGA domain-containing protein [Candidatus Shapirobacteria bacterium]|jgi:hypothetical protein
MKKILLGLILAFTLSGCDLQLKKAGVEIISKPSAKVIINNKEAGMTPYKNESLTPGVVKVKLVFDKGEWEKEILLEKNVTTVVDWENENQGSGYILSLERTGDKGKSGLMVNVDPNKAIISVDGEILGYSPIKIEDIGVGDKQIKISFPGFGSKTLFVKARAEYRLVVEAKLTKDEIIQPTPTMALTQTENPEVKMVTIKATETGWLRVREEANSGSKEKARVNPGEKYELIKSEGGWAQIKLKNGESGWVSASYVDSGE